MELKKEYYQHLIPLALKEDLLETGDVTSSAIFKNEQSSFALFAKDEGILCGSQIFIDTFLTVDQSLKIHFLYQDGDHIKKGDIIAKVEGNVLSALQGERTAINFLGHLSGIASKTALFVKETKGKIKILDTRKTLPAYRMLHKYAVNCGGGFNHRIGLFDMILIKDNHIDACGSITKAVNKVKENWGDKYKIEVETRNIEEIEEALKAQVDRIMLDNIDLDMMTKAVDIINKRAETEISGNVTLQRIKELSKTGADFVSIGELTHTVKVFDFSLKKEEK